jgi:hypothetical protein
MAQYKSAMRHGKFIHQNSLRPYYSTDKWDEQNIPSGIIFLFEDSDCPTGYENVNHSSKFLQAGVSYAEDGGGNETHSHTSTNHNHSLNAITAPKSGYYCYPLGAASYAAGYHAHTVAYGTSSDSSPNTGNGDIDNVEIQTYKRYVLCRKI